MKVYVNITVLHNYAHRKTCVDVYNGVGCLQVKWHSAGLSFVGSLHLTGLPAQIIRYLSLSYSFTYTIAPSAHKISLIILWKHAWAIRNTLFGLGGTFEVDVKQIRLKVTTFCPASQGSPTSVPPTWTFSWGGSAPL